MGNYSCKGDATLIGRPSLDGYHCEVLDDVPEDFRVAVRESVEANIAIILQDRTKVTLPLIDCLPGRGEFNPFTVRIKLGQLADENCRDQVYMQVDLRTAIADAVEWISDLDKDIDDEELQEMLGKCRQFVSAWRRCADEIEALIRDKE